MFFTKMAMIVWTVKVADAVDGLIRGVIEDGPTGEVPDVVLAGGLAVGEGGSGKAVAPAVYRDARRDVDPIQSLCPGAVYNNTYCYAQVKLLLAQSQSSRCVCI